MFKKELIYMNSNLKNIINDKSDFFEYSNLLM